MNAITLYRIGNWFFRYKMSIISKIIQGLIFLLYNSYIPYSCKIGKGTIFGYKGMGVVIHSRAVIGKNCRIAQQVTIGGRSKHYDVPIIGDNVRMSCGSKILGPVKVGKNVVIGANAVLICDAPDNTVWAGVPARLIKENINPEDYA